VGLIVLLTALSVTVVVVAKGERLATAALFGVMIAVVIMRLRQAMKAGDTVGSFGPESGKAAPVWALVLFAAFLGALGWVIWTLK
jgi:hypothetical protein